MAERLGRERDFYLDLLSYHCILCRLVAIEPKLGSFDAAYKGHMELYMKLLDRYERRLERSCPLGSSCAARGTVSRSNCISGRCWRPSCAEPYGWRRGLVEGAQKTERIYDQVS